MSGRAVEIPHLTCPTCPISLRTSKKFQFTCPGTRKALAKNIKIMKYIIFLFLKKTYVVGTQWKCLGEALLTCTHNVCFLQEIRKMSIFGQLNSHWASGFWPFTCLWQVKKKFYYSWTLVSGQENLCLWENAKCMESDHREKAITSKSGWHR